MRLKKAYMAALVAMALLAGGPVLRAQNTQQQAQQTQQTQQKVKDRSVKMNHSVQDQKLKGRYRPKNQQFHKGGFFANTYVTFMGAYYRQFTNSYSSGPYANIAFGKWITALHGVELGLGACTFKDNYDARRMYITQARLSYLFNISDYTGDYNPNKLIDLYAKAGLGYGFYLREGFPKVNSPSAHLGVQLNMHIFPGIDLVVEPLLEVQLDARKLPRMDVWRKYLLALQGGVGLKVNLDPYRYGADPGTNWFVTAIGGVQIPISDFGRQMGLARSFGPTANIGVGRYYAPNGGENWLALRLMFGSSTNFWKEIEEGAMDPYGNPLEVGRFRSTYFYSRLEAKVDVLRLVAPMFARYTQLGAALIAGPEVGWMIKKDPNLYDIRYAYVGLSAGIQLSVNLYRGLFLNIEPRASIVPYSATSFEWANTNKDYYDVLMGVSLGVEYRFGRYYL